MRLLFVADGRSPIALNWISYFVESGHEVHLVSTFACDPDLQLASLSIIPVAFSGAAAGQDSQPSPGRDNGWIKKLLPVSMRTTLRQWLGPMTLSGAARRLRQVVDDLQPEMVHAMRIPYEGMLAALALEGRLAPPLLVSIWGNDFTLHAPSNPWMGSLTRRTLRRASALHADCRRDVRLGLEWGFDAARPTAVLPGGGGIQLDVFYPLNILPKFAAAPEATRPVRVINPRGIRAYVRSDAFFRSIPLVLERRPEVRFLCSGMAGQARAQRWVDELGIAEAVELLPQVPRPRMADIFRSCQVVVSPSTHDGTPNTLLEAMACGCFPVVGNIEALREWITDGENGYLVDPADPADLANAILKALADSGLRQRASETNTRLVAERAEYRRVMKEAEIFYSQKVIARE
jgi:glycosyltransferase involved in cell wall biosynthesis